MASRTMDAPSPATKPALTPPTLRFITGDAAGHMVLVTKDRVVLGRSEGADVTVPDDGTSREHSAITRASDGWRLEDLKSRNGTLLNGTKLVAPATLKPGDRIRIGITELEFDIVTPPAAGTRLEVLEGPTAPAHVALSGTLAVIGRDIGKDKCQVAIGPDAEAAEHAQLSLRGGAWRLRSCHADCETFLNGDRVTSEVRLKTGDRIRIGRTLLEFVDGRIDELGGQTIEEQTLATRVGAGTLGVVYRARDARGGATAVKLLDPGLKDDAGAVARFANGARSQMRVTHPNVVRILKVAQNAVLPAVVMEWIPGGSLAEKLSATPKLSVERCLTMAKDIANAMAAAEKERVSHQGLRPGNILFDAEGTAMVGDFTMCAPFDPLQPGEGGDSRWIAPEEATGGAADARANQFSFGLILYQCLTGRPPFGPGTRAEVANARIGGGVPALRAQVPEVSQGFDRLVSRLLARAPAHRFATWDEARAQIDAVIAGKDLPTPPGGTSILGATATAKRSPSSVLPAVAPSSRPGEGKRPSEVRRPSEIRRPSEVMAAAATAAPATVPPSAKPTERLRSASSSRTVPKQSLGRELGIPSSAWAGIGVLVIMLVAIVLLSTMRRTPGTADTEAGRNKPSPSSGTATGTQPLWHPSATAATPPSPGAGLVPASAPAPQLAQAAPGAAPTAIDLAHPPELRPRVLMESRIGGAGDQAISEVGFDAQGNPFAKGSGFSVQIDAADGKTTVSGDPATADANHFDARPRLPTQARSVVDPRSGRSVNVGTRQAGAQLQLPLVSGQGWTWWDAPPERILALGLGADTRCYGADAVADTRFVAAFWCEAANTCLVRDPRDIAKPMPGLSSQPDGAASCYVLLDGSDGTPLKTMFLPAPPCARAVDAWGRIYLAASASTHQYDTRLPGQAGLSVLAADLGSVLVDMRFGGESAADRGIEAFGSIAIKDGLLVLGGTTAARALAGVNATQTNAGGGQDALVVVIRLWGDADAPVSAQPPTPDVPATAKPAPAAATTTPSPTQKPVPAKTPEPPAPKKDIKDIDSAL